MQLNRKIGVVLKGYPRLSETFIAQEILELEREGFDLEIVSLRHPTDKSVHPVHREIKAEVNYLPEYLHQEPVRVIKAWMAARKLPGYRRARAAFLSDLARDRTRNRIRRFGQALVLAAEYAPRYSFLYVHFIHTPASVARYAAIMIGLRLAISAHAKDIWTIPAWELAEKLGECEWCVTCTKGGLAELQQRAPQPGKVNLVYHGIDFSRFPPAALRPARDGSSADDPVRFLTVGRAVEKKGIDTLIDALALLPESLNWRWTHIGGGPLRERLQARASRLGLEGSCEFLGGRPQEQVLERYRQSDVFVLPSRIDPTGDRDGLPNVLVEAQCLGLPVISTPMAGISELIDDGLNGILVSPDDPASLAVAMERLGRDPALRRQFGEAGEKRVRRDFDHKHAIGRLVDLLGNSLAPVAERTA